MAEKDKSDGIFMYGLTMFMACQVIYLPIYPAKFSKRSQTCLPKIYCRQKLYVKAEANYKFKFYSNSNS